MLAAGDYANNPRMISEHKGADFSLIEGIDPFSTGDGQQLAASVGGRLLNMDVTYGPELRFIPPSRKPFSQLLPSSGLAAHVMGRLMPLVPKWFVTAMIKRLLVTWQHPEENLFQDGAILINRQAARFCDETRSPLREIAIAGQPDKIAFILLDAELADRYSKWPHFISTAPEIAYAYTDDYLRMRPDVAIEAYSWREIAAKRNIPKQLTLNCDHVPPPKRELRGNRLVLLGPVKAYFTTTEGGAAIDHKFRVLDESDAPIEGLYAVGQTGLGGQILWGHGLHIAWAMTSGRLVGLGACRSASRQDRWATARVTDGTAVDSRRCVGYRLFRERISTPLKALMAVDFKDDRITLNIHLRLCTGRAVSILFQPRIARSSQNSPPLDRHLPGVNGAGSLCFMSHYRPPTPRY